jgi:hypothetical protein
LYHMKNDRRALRSAEAIYEALVKLMGEKRADQTTLHGAPIHRRTREMGETITSPS